MNFEFSDDLMQLRDQARRYLAEHCTSKHVRAVLEGEKPYDGALWQGMADMGWLGAAIGEEYGGAGLGHEGLCVLAGVRICASSPRRTRRGSRSWCWPICGPGA